MANLRFLLLISLSIALATEYVQCGDSEYGCKKGTTCCTSGSESEDWVCCPYEDAICCNDKGGHCCPVGYPICDVKHKKCKDHLLNEAPSHTRLAAVQLLKIERREDSEYLVTGF